MTEAELEQKLLARIKARRASIGLYASRMKPPRVRLSRLIIICSGIVAALTAGPALGGTRFTEGIQHLLSIPDDSLVWQVLCLLATVLSILTVVLTNLDKPDDVSSRLAQVHASNNLLEGLETMLEFGQVPAEVAAKLYQQYVADIPFIPEQE